MSTRGVFERETVLCPAREQVVDIDRCEKCLNNDAIDEEGGVPGTIHCRVTRRASRRTAFERKLATMLGEHTRISTVMTASVLCLTPDVSVEAAAAMILEANVSGAPVVDTEGSPIGVVSRSDLLRERLERGDVVESAALPEELRRGFHVDGASVSTATVQDVMTPLAFTLPQTESLSTAAALMATEGVHRLPIVDDEGRVVGILSALDVLRWLAG
jgi:CBS domain-containing protein